MPSPDIPSQNPEPGPESTDSSAFEGDIPFSGPEEHYSPLEEAEAFLLHQFETRAEECGWSIVPDEVQDELGPSWEAAFLDKFLGGRFGILPEREAVSVLIQAVAQDEDSYYVLASFCDESESLRFYASGPDRIVKLDPGCTCAFMLAFPKQGEPDFNAPADEDSEDLSYALFVDELSLQRESARFAAGDLEGLIGNLLREEAGVLEMPLGEVKQIAMGLPAESEVLDGSVFHIGTSQGERFLFEVTIAPRTGGIYTSGPAPISEDALIPDTSRSSELSPAQQRERLITALAQSELSLISRDDPRLDALCRIFLLDLPRYFQDWQPALDWTLEVESIHVPDSGENEFLVEVSIQSEDGSYFFPSLNGSGTLKSTLPISFFFGARPDFEPPERGRYRYQLRMAAIPPETGLAPVAAILIRSPQHSLLIRHIECSIGMELELPPEEIRQLRVTSVLAVPDDPRIDAQDQAEVADANENPCGLRLLCFHQRGASVVVLETDEAGIIDLTSIRAPCFFAGLEPPRAPDPSEQP